jgi:hypothetical protein
MLCLLRTRKASKSLAVYLAQPSWFAAADAEWLFAWATFRRSDRLRILVASCDHFAPSVDPENW